MCQRMLRMAALLLAAGLLAPAGAHAQQEEGQPSPPPEADFVYVNTQAILQEAPGAEQARQTWASELKEYRAEVEQLRAEIDSLRSSLSQQQEMLSDEAAARRQQAIQQKQQELARRVQELEQQAARRQQELLNPILQKVQTVLREIREEQGYTMVFDASAAGVLAADPRLDITDLVIQRLQGQAAAPPAPDPAGSAAADPAGSAAPAPGGASAPDA